jgi:hypothetical protein
MTKIINELAFPAYDHLEQTMFDGMSLRDYFAAKAMQGMLAACTGWSDAYQERMAKTSYMMADQMLIERQK